MKTQRRLRSRPDNAQAAVDAIGAGDRWPTASTRSRAMQHQLVADGRRHRDQSARSRRNCRRTRAIAPTPTLRRWRKREDRRLYGAGPGQDAAGKEEAARPCVAAMRERSRPGGHSSPYRLREQLPSRCSDRSSRRAASVSSSARRREGRRRVGPRLPRPQHLKARPRRTPSLPHSQPAELRHLGNGANERWPQSFHPYIKPDAQICCIRLSDWLERFKSHLAGIKQTGS